jgi:hypothetical protein
MASTERDGVRYFNCCICDEVFEGWGNNPYPVKNTLGEDFGEDDWCCNDCNNKVVIPERMKEMSL